MADTNHDRRQFINYGALAAATAGMAAVALTPAAADAQSAGGNALPNLYPNLNAREFRAIRAHENAHVPAVIALIQQLGGTPRPKPNFKNLLQPNIKAFGATSQTLENTGVGANRGAAAIIFGRPVLEAATSIALIEARHAGYLNALFNTIHTTDVFGAEQEFEKPLTQQQVVQLATPFIQDFAGGPPPGFNLTPSRANDIAILNFVLVIEHLENEFYNLNVPRFFPG